MNMSILSPWQLLLWIVCLEVLSIPLIVILVNSIIIGYFKAKRDHIGKMANSFAKAFEKITNDIVAREEQKKTEEEQQFADTMSRLKDIVKENQNVSNT